MANEKLKTKLKFAPGEPAPPTDSRGNVLKKKGQPLKSPLAIEIADGQYRRVFKTSEQPFECSAEEAEMLLRTGHFVEAMEELAAEPAGEPDGEKVAAEDGQATDGAGESDKSAGRRRSSAKPTE